MTVTRHVHTRPRVAIVIPVYNEQESLQALRVKLNALQQKLRDRFLVFYFFVDDGSTDQTVALLAQTAPEGAQSKVLSHDKNRGIGAAFRTGFEAAGSADVVCTLDADCSYHAEDLAHMVNLVVEGKADAVVASPYHPQGAVDGIPPWRLALSRYCSFLYRKASPLKLYTYTSMFRAYRGSLVRRIQFRSSGFVSTVEILLYASYLGYRIHEIPTTLHRRVAGYSKMRILRTIREHLRLLCDCLLAKNHGYPSFCQPRGASQTQGEDHEMGRLIEAPGSR